MQHAPWLLAQTPLWQLLLALKRPVHWLAMMFLHIPLL
jgi:hypothetical protein